MRTDGKMSFKDFIFPINPRIIRISHQRIAAKADVPYGKSVVEDLGSKGRIISGEGEFCGEGCIRDFLRLREVMDRGGSGILYLPSQSPIRAVFEMLELTAADAENVISYSFRFEECAENEVCQSEYIIDGDGISSLWDISYRYNIGIDRLAALNDHIRRPDIAVELWEKVKLC